MMRGVVLSFVGVCLCAGSTAHAQAILDPGFEQILVPSGDFLRPTTGAWTYVNDAGVVRPPGRSTGTEVFDTWSATRPAFEGAQYASTYAGSDTITQPVTFNRAGTYELSVMAFSPSGILEIPGNPGLFMPLERGEFSFQLGGQVGPTWVVPLNSDWTRYATTFDVPAPGAYPVGIANTRSAVYFVNYDDFRITPVPEPSAAALVMMIVGCAASGHRRLPRPPGRGARGTRTLRPQRS